MEARRGDSTWTSLRARPDPQKVGWTWRLMAWSRQEFRVSQTEPWEPRDRNHKMAMSRPRWSSKRGCGGGSPLSNPRFTTCASSLQASLAEPCRVCREAQPSMRCRCCYRCRDTQGLSGTPRQDEVKPEAQSCLVARWTLLLLGLRLVSQTRWEIPGPPLQSAHYSCAHALRAARDKHGRVACASFDASRDQEITVPRALTRCKCATASTGRVLGLLLTLGLLDHFQSTCTPP